MMQSSCLLVYACCYCFLSPHEYASHVNSIHCFAFQVPQTKLVTFFVYHTFAPLSGTHSGAFKIKKVRSKKILPDNSITYLARKKQKAFKKSIAKRIFPLLKNCIILFFSRCTNTNNSRILIGALIVSTLRLFINDQSL